MSIQSISRIRTMLFILPVLLILAPRSNAQRVGEPVVARAGMQFVVKGKTLDTIAKGDVLTIQQIREDAFLVMTPSGQRGWVPKVNALQLAEAVEVYDELLKTHPKDGGLHTMRASARWARGDRQQAVQDCDRAIALNYKEPDVYVSRALFKMALQKHEEAIADFSEAIKLAPKSASSYINRAAVYMAQQKYESAISDYSAAIKLAPKNSSYHQQRAVAWKAHGQAERAIADFSRAIEHTPQHVPALMGRGFTQFELGRNAKAVEDFTRVIEIDPKAAPAFNNRGYNLQLMGDYKKALADYNQAIALAPNYSLAYQNKAWLLAIVKDEKIRDGKQAIGAAKKACELNNYKYVGDLRVLAAALAEDGQFAEAIGWQEKVVAMFAEDKKQQEFEQEILQRFQNKQRYPVDELAAREENENAKKQAGS